MPLVSCNRELILLLDRVHNLEIIGQAIVTETNHAHQTVTNLAAALEFAEKIGFPSHGLVVMFDKILSTLSIFLRCLLVDECGLSVAVFV